jgi:hypothetical protein
MCVLLYFTISICCCMYLDASIFYHLYIVLTILVVLAHVAPQHNINMTLALAGHMLAWGDDMDSCCCHASAWVFFKYYLKGRN